MQERKYTWFLIGVKPGENLLAVLNMGRSVQNAELMTEHEPKALAVLKRNLSSEEIEGYRLHACRLLVSDNRVSIIKEERRRWRDEFRRFLARCGFTLVEQKEMVDAFAEETIKLFRQIADDQSGIRPLSQSILSKTISTKVK